MRTDENLARNSFRFSSQWETNAQTGEKTPAIDRRLKGGSVRDGRYIAHALSGSERNHLFLNRGGRQFDDISLLSGLDTPADSRTFVLLDYDRDGWQDIALVNANSPLMNLYHNQMGAAKSSATSGGHGMIALRFIGANRESKPSTSQSCRDGYGAKVTVALGNMSLSREHRCGDGYGAQNSATMIVGIGARASAESVSVRWPSGKIDTVRNVMSGTLLTVYENPADSPSGSPFVSQPYRSTGGEPIDVARLTADRPAARTLMLDGVESLPPGDSSKTKLRVYTTMATWCAACRSHLPQVEYLRSMTATDGVDIIGLPVDENDDAEKLRAYAAQWKPAYRLLVGLKAPQRSAVEELLARELPEAALPSTIVTDPSGRVLLTVAGLPSVSQLRELIARETASE
ncbi:MAG: ASPIC/UnbV domain-containing protein [Planctomycetes bacterium]|nr:ASPIC/UnbV domain-containing protein [Planctomycetota bacterium]